MSKIVVMNSRRVSDFLGFKVKNFEDLNRNINASEFVKKYEKYLNSANKNELKEFFKKTGLIIEHLYLQKSGVIRFNMFGSTANTYRLKAYNYHLQIRTKVEELNIENGIIYDDGKKIYDLKDDEGNEEKIKQIEHINDLLYEKLPYDKETYESEKQVILEREIGNLENFENTCQRVLSPYGDIFYLTEDGTLFCNDKEYDKNVETVWERDRYNKLIIFKDNKVEYLSSTFIDPFEEVYDKILYGDKYLAILKDKTLKVIVTINPYLYRIKSTAICFTGVDDIECGRNRWNKEELIIYTNGNKIKYLISDVEIKNC